MSRKRVSAKSSAPDEAVVGRKSLASKYLMLILLFAILVFGCDSFPLFNIFGENENPSHAFLIKPVLNLSQVRRVGSVYGTPNAGEGGTDHNGIDIGVDPGTPFIAAFRGIVLNIAWDHDETSEVVAVELRYNEEFTIGYLFEPPQAIAVQEGDLVEEGELIGTVGSREAGYIDQCVHFSVNQNGQTVCPVPYLRADLRKRLNDVYHMLPGRIPANLCGCPEHQYLFAP